MTGEELAMEAAGALQQRYIELLEKRVAQLEKAVQDGESKKKDEDQKGKPEAEASSRYRNILRKWDKESGSYKDETVGANFFVKQQVKNVAYTFRRVYNPETGDKGAYSELIIEDPDLIHLLKEEIGTYPGIKLDSDMVTMRNPFPPLIHNWLALSERSKKEPDSQKTKDLGSLLERVKTAPECYDYFKVRDSYLASEVVTFDTLWTVFAPGTLIVARIFEDVTQILKVQNSPIPWSASHKNRYNDMWAWNWDWDGKRMIKVEYKLRFERFRGTKSITDLQYYPLHHHKDAAQLRKKARDRAKKFITATARCSLGASQMFRYNGLAYTDQRNILKAKQPEGQGQNEENESSNEPMGTAAVEPKRVPVKGEIIVDPEAFIQQGLGYLPLAKLHTGDDIFQNPLHMNGEEYAEFAEKVKNLAVDQDLDENDDNFVVVSPRVLGYATREKVWGQFNLDYMDPAGEAQTDHFNKDLELDGKYKTLIWALVASHKKSNKQVTQVTDVVQDKGRGLVLLLHGPPGVGKTLTAETIAQATGRPLVVVSVAEIGLDASRAERNLERLFTLATKWEAILLVDEADVFLETRGSTSNASRNALVSVLLRVLEYYRGIIILTTNRIKTIDIAVISRIHLAIRYEDLTDQQMGSIFGRFLDQLDDGDVYDRDQIDEWIGEYGPTYKLNGRQIRNVVAAALAAARHEKVKPPQGKSRCDGRMTKKHLKAVCDLTRAFQDQLKDVADMQRYNNEARGTRT